MNRLRAGALLLLLTGGHLAPLPAQQATGSSEAGFFSGLAGPGGSVRFEYDAAPDGTPARVRISQTPTGDFGGLVATGTLLLETDEFRLLSQTLDYTPLDDLMVATGDVDIVRADVEATAQELRYTISNGDIALRGEPDVLQKTEGQNTRFQGMDLFTIRTQESGERTLDLEGDAPITIDMDNAPEPAPGAEPAPPAEGQPQGFAAFGDKVTIVTSPRTGDGAPIPPRVESRVNAEGALDFFRARGSVRLKSELLDLRADELLYEPERQIVEAIGHVFLRRDGIEADCGRMLYDLSSGQITLTINPVVSQFGQSSVTTVSDIDYFIIVQRPDGGADVEYGSSTGPGRTEIRNLGPGETPGGVILPPPPQPKPTPAPAEEGAEGAEPVAAVPPPPSAIEIDTQNPSQLP